MYMWREKVEECFFVFQLSSLQLILPLQKEHYLGLTLGNDNWWRRNGIGCPSMSMMEGESGGGTMVEEEEECLVSYAVRHIV